MSAVSYCYNNTLLSSVVYEASGLTSHAQLLDVTLDALFDKFGLGHAHLMLVHQMYQPFRVAWFLGVRVVDEDGVIIGDLF